MITGGSVLVNMLEGGGIVILVIVALFGILVLYIIYDIFSAISSAVTPSKMSNPINWGNGVSYIRH